MMLLACSSGIIMSRHQGDRGKMECTGSDFARALRSQSNKLLILDLMRLH